MEYENIKNWYSLCYDKDGFRVSYYGYDNGYSELTSGYEESKGSQAGAKLSIDISQKKNKTILTMYNFSDYAGVSKEQTQELFGKYKEITFEKVPNQDLYEYPNSVWKNEKLGYVVEVEEDDAYCILEYESKKERYRLNSSFDAYVIEYEEATKEYNTGVSFLSKISESDTEEMLMTWYDFEDVNVVSQKSKKQTQELFKKMVRLLFIG